MTFKEIIKENTDRLFIVDTECFIVFTGSSINDDRPFIRFGTWYDLPIEIVPLIENVILSDKILGNPAHEQFNIDIRNLIANRYIGSESILRRFLDYQKNFGLDLTNVSVVNIEKDIPELPKHSSISDRDQFIGVFYSDGNIKIVNDGTDIFNLNSILGDNLSIAEIHERISSGTKGNDRYAGAGFVISGNNPIFYSGGHFTAYQYPLMPFEDFSSLDIDPAKIREVLLPSQNILNLSSLMKFKHSRDGRIRIFSDNPEQIELIRKLFKNATIMEEMFSSMAYNTGDGLKITNYGNSPNLKLQFRLKGAQPEDLTVAFIKLHHDTRRIIKENPDLVIITYTAYEESALLFKSSEVPLVLIDDGNKNVNKIGESKPVVRRAFQYEFRKLSSVDELTDLLELPAEMKNAVRDKDSQAIEQYVSAAASDRSDLKQQYNTEALLHLCMNSTEDRRFYSAAREMLQKYFPRSPRIIPGDNWRSHRIILAIHRDSCYQVVKGPVESNTEPFTDIYSRQTVNESSICEVQKRLGERILYDRERLFTLLRHFYNDRKSTGRHEKLIAQVRELKEEINNRKEIYSGDLYQTGDSVTAYPGISTVPGTPAGQGIFPEGEHGAAGGYTRQGVHTGGLSASADKGTAAKSGAAGAILSIPSMIMAAFTGKGEAVKHDAARAILEEYGYKSGPGPQGGKKPLRERIVSFITGADQVERAEGYTAAMKARIGVISALLLILLLSLALLIRWQVKSRPDAAGQSGSVMTAEEGPGLVKTMEISPGETEETMTVDRVNSEEKALLEERNVKIRDIDIFNYANDVALKNGYEKITYTGIREKNPHWIYPSNIFIMLDGEKVVVRSGDTLWDLSRAKLQKMNASFYRIIEELEKTDPSATGRIRELTDQAEELAYIPKQKEIIKQYRLKAGNE